MIYIYYVYNMRVLGRAQVPSQYHSTSAECKARGTSTVVLVLVLALKLKATLLKSKTEVLHEVL
jgi:hypothetical protein